MAKIGIIGMGVIGCALHKLFPGSHPHDPALGMTNNLKHVDFVFICVPTDLKDGVLDMSIVREVITNNGKLPIYIICSALQPGTADDLIGMGFKVVVQPEYFGESVCHPLSDLSAQKFLILGGDPLDVGIVVGLYKTVYNANIRIRKVTALEAEVIKLSENRAIAFKVLQCQELYDACVKNGVDYDIIREAVYGDDPRFNLWWTFVYPDKRGCQSKCIPKDVYGWQHWAGGDLTGVLLEYNERLTAK